MPIFQKQTDPFRMHMLGTTAPCAEAVLRGSPVIKDRFNRYPEFHASLPSSPGKLVTNGAGTPTSFHSLRAQ